MKYRVYFAIGWSDFVYFVYHDHVGTGLDYPISYSYLCNPGWMIRNIMKHHILLWNSLSFHKRSDSFIHSNGFHYLNELDCILYMYLYCFDPKPLFFIHLYTLLFTIYSYDLSFLLILSLSLLHNFHNHHCIIMNHPTNTYHKYTYISFHQQTI